MSTSPWHQTGFFLELINEQDNVNKKAEEIKKEFVTEVPEDNAITPEEWLNWKLDKIETLEKDAKRLQEYMSNQQGAKPIDIAPFEKAYFSILKDIKSLREDPLTY